MHVFSSVKTKLRYLQRKYAYPCQSRLCKIPLSEFCNHCKSVAFYSSKENKKQLQNSTLQIFDITGDIHLVRDFKNNIKEIKFIDLDGPFGPPLCLLLPQVACTDVHVAGYVNLYVKRGFDVLVATLSQTQLMYPTKPGNGVSIATDLLKYLQENQRHRPIVVHGFSSGTYVFGEMLAQFKENPDKYNRLMGNFRGCLWDSYIDLHHTVQGISFAVFPRMRYFRYLHESYISICLKNNKETLKYWKRSHENFSEPILKVPNVFFVSTVDPLSNPDIVSQYRGRMESCGIVTYQKTWDDSNHVQHFIKHENDYIYGVELFLTEICKLSKDFNGKFVSDTNKSLLTSLPLKRRIPKNKIL